MQAENSLFRWSDHEEGVELDNHDQILLKPEYFTRLLTISTIDAFHNLIVNNDQLLCEVKEALQFDNITKNYKSLLKSESREFKKSLVDWNFENRLLLYWEKVYILKNKKEQLQRWIVKMHYNLPLAGHPGC